MIQTLPTIRKSLFASAERWLWYLFLAALPVQTRLIVWSDRTPFSEWFSAALWATDVLCIALLGVAFLRDRRWMSRRADAADLLAVALVLVAAMSVARAPAPLLALVGTVRIAAGVMLFWYARAYAQRRFDADRSVLAFVLGALMQAVLGLGQYLSQHDMGIRVLGETLLRTDMRGVAVFFDATGEKILRAYGTLPHPNLLAMVLMLAIFGLLWLFVRHSTHHRGHGFVWGSAGTLLVWGLAATYARTVVGAGIVAIAGLTAVLWSPVSRTWTNAPVVRRRVASALLVAGIAGLFFAATQWPQLRARAGVSSDEEAVRLRVTYNREAISSGTGWALHVNWAGVGVANFVPWLERWDPGLPRHLVQPAHNLFLLAYTELGAVGVLVLMAWIAVVLRTGWNSWSGQPALRLGIFCVAGVILVSALLDHFFWTLQQGRLLWWLAWAIIAGRLSSSSSSSRVSRLSG